MRTSVKQVWATWDIQILILTSLLIQAFLTIFGPLRKWCARREFKFVMWFLYLSADSVALYTIGLIAKSHGVSPDTTKLHAFWAPFLLLHLGGPDTITALALEDNELWKRHALQFVTQVGLTIYVFFKSFQHLKEYMWVPTILMFIDGCIKYTERISALHFASADTFRSSVASGPSYAWLMEEYYAASNAHLPAKLQRRPDTAEGAIKSEEEVYKQAYERTPLNNEAAVVEVRRI